MDDTPRLPVDALDTFITRIFAALHLVPDDARTVARCLVTAHLRGFDTHGVACIPGYVDCLREGRIKSRPDTRVHRTHPGACVVEGDNGMGHVSATRAMTEAVSAAAELGIGMATVRHGNHIGAACIYPLMAAAEGCIGITVANAAPTVAPWGSRQVLLGTNPIAAAVPAGDHPPLVIDMATSIAARRKMRDAAARGEPIPEGWALDSEGRPTTDPEAALVGTLLPFGGYKGSAICLLIDVLAGVYSGSAFGGDVLSFLKNHERPSDSGNFHLALRADAFMPAEAFGQRADILLDRINSLEPAADFDSVRYPGQRGAELEKERRTNGIPVNADLFQQLNKLAEDLAVPPPAPVS